MNELRLEGDANMVSLWKTKLDQYIMCLTQAELWGWSGVGRGENGPLVTRRYAKLKRGLWMV